MTEVPMLLADYGFILVLGYTPEKVDVLMVVLIVKTCLKHISIQ